MIKILTIGKKHEDWVSVGIERYEKRLQKPYNVEWVLLPHSSLEGTRARQEESERILSRLDDSTRVLLLDDTGAAYDNAKVASVLEDALSHASQVVVVIGGAYGVSMDLKERADVIWSLSPLVFPHQLVRLLLVEQLYRSQSLLGGGKYHHA